MSDGFRCRYCGKTVSGGSAAREMCREAPDSVLYHEPQPASGNEPQSIDITADVFVQAQIETVPAHGFAGSRQVPTFALPNRILGLSSWQAAERAAASVLLTGAVVGTVAHMALSWEGNGTRTAAFVQTVSGPEEVTP